ncbi:MAG: cysteine desulfurase family protein [Methyloceanibacter sp.]
MTERAYLDYNATAPLRPEAGEAMVAALSLCGNPSSVHAEGRTARAAIETAREKVAALLRARPEDVIFTSGGTEANALGLAPQTRHERLCVSAVEHPSVLAGGRFSPAQVSRIPVTSDGVMDLDFLASELAKHHLEGTGARPFVSLMAANNETGALQPVTAVAELVQAAGGVLHSDGVQAAGKVPLDMAALGADMVSLSAHKLGGPKGVGALVLRKGTQVEPQFKGGAQERRRRAGTENVAGIVGFGTAAEIAAAELDRAKAIAGLRDELEARALALVPEAVVLSAGVARLPNTSCIAVAGTKAETLVIGLDLAGVAVSSGSACSSGKVEASHVLSAMGVGSELERSAIRVSLGYGSTLADVDRFVEAWVVLVKRLMQSREAA